MIRLVVSDLDGTLLCNNQISKTNINVIKELKEKGFQFTVATGRHLNSAKTVIKKLDLSLPFICSNGAQVIDSRSFETIHEVLIDKNNLQKLGDYLDENPSPYMITTNTEIYCTNHFKDLLLEYVGDVPVTIVSEENLTRKLGEKIIKVLVIEFDHDKLYALSNFVSTKENLIGVISQEGFFNISHADATKGKALDYLINRLGLSHSEICTIGDQENDTSLLRNVGLGIAVENAVEPLRRIADHVTETNCNNGVAIALNKFLLKKYI